MPRHAIAVIGAMLLCAACLQPLRLAPDDSDRVLTELLIAAPNPSAPGPYGVRTLYYGSGTDKRRSEYRDSRSGPRLRSSRRSTPCWTKTRSNTTNSSTHAVFWASVSYLAGVW
jgi:hypothetical protein